MRRHIPNHVHGTAGGYVNWGCRCTACTEANTAKQSRARDTRLAAPTPDHVHGSMNGYTNYGCRCVECREANRLSKAAHRARQRETREV